MLLGAQWLSGRVLDSRPTGRGFEPHRLHCVVSLSKSIYPSLVLVQPRKTRPFITERLLMGRKELNQTNKNKTNYAPLVADLFLSCYERDFMLFLSDSNYADVLKHQIYPTELQLNKANSSYTEAPFLDLYLSITNGTVSTKLYDKRDILILK